MRKDATRAKSQSYGTTTGRRLSDERVNHNFTHNFSLLMTTAAYFKIIGEADIKQTSQSLCAWKLSYHSQSSI